MWGELIINPILCGHADFRRLAAPGESIACGVGITGLVCDGPDEIRNGAGAARTRRGLHEDYSQRRHIPGGS